MSDDTAIPEAHPRIEVLKGKPTDAELAALVSVLASGGQCCAAGRGDRSGPVGAPGRRPVLPRRQLAAGHAGGADAHAAMTRLVLASASPARLTVLRQAGVDPLVIVSNVDEDALIAEHPGSSPERVVTLLAAAKAMESASRLPADVAAGLRCGGL